MSEAHQCHHPTCNTTVPPSKLACRIHWYQLPAHLRNKVWNHYRKGQELDKRPTRAYIAAVRECQRYWLGIEAT